MDTAFAKIVEDTNGRHHILIEGSIVSLVGPDQRNNELVDLIVRGLRKAGKERSSIGGDIIPLSQSGQAIGGAQAQTA